ncbi:MAG: hypothetical protein KY469_09650 [Actinobacteria bacterium]|nr:hypothetical protein [Actinomycetota bacterium]
MGEGLVLVLLGVAAVLVVLTVVAVPVAVVWLLHRGRGRTVVIVVDEGTLGCSADDAAVDGSPSTASTTEER